MDHLDGLTADIRLSLFRTLSLVIDTVAVEKCTSAAIHRFEVVLTGGGMDVPGGRVSTGPTGGDGGWDEHPGGLPCVRVAPGHGAQDSGLLSAARPGSAPPPSVSFRDLLAEENKAVEPEAAPTVDEPEAGPSPDEPEPIDTPSVNYRSLLARTIAKSGH